MLLAVFITATASEPPPPLRASYLTLSGRHSTNLGTGYDIIVGDPQSGDDVGWKFPLFEKDWVEENDADFHINKCSYQSVFSSISGGGSAQASLLEETTISGSAGGGFGGWGAKIAFTASHSVQTFTEMSKTTFEHVYEARASCELYRLALPPPGGVAIKASTDFEARVRRLPNASGAESDKLLENWMVDYGTHYASSIVLGGKMALRWTLTKSSYSTYQAEARKSSFSTEVGVESAFESFATGAAISKENTAANAFEEALEGREAVEIYLGGAPFVKDDLAKWAAGLEDAPALVGGKQFELRQITELLTPLNFPGLSPGVQATAEEFFRRLCTPEGSNLGHDKCTPNAVDPRAYPVIPPITIATGSKIQCVAWARDGASVATGDDDRYVRTWDVITSKANLTLSGHTGQVTSVAYSPDGMHLASGSFDHTIRIWDTATGQSTRTLSGHTSIVLSVAYSPDGMHLASGSFDNTIRIWDTATGQSTRTLTGHTDGVSSVAYSPDGVHLASGSFDHTIRIWDTATGQVTRTLSGHTGFVNSVAYSPDGTHLASGSDDNTIRTWDSTAGQYEAIINCPAGCVSVNARQRRQLLFGSIGVECPNGCVPA